MIKKSNLGGYVTWLCGLAKGVNVKQELGYVVGGGSQAGYVYDARYSEGKVVGSEIKVVSKRVTAFD